MLQGIVLVDKPQGPTSHTVVAVARKRLNLKKVGHAGTLDPMATGLLVVGVGAGTKLLTYCVGMDKTYRATIRLGRSTHTDDAEGEPLGEALDSAALNALDERQIGAALEQFVGDIEQVPSAVSAIKVDGRKAYDRVRAGEDVVLAPRRVTIRAIEVQAFRRDGEMWDVDVEIDCSSGTYIRAIARDLGHTLAVGGHLVALRRTRVGPFDVAAALPPDGIDPAVVVPLGDAAAWIAPVCQLTASQSVEMRHGKKIFLDPPKGVGEHQPVACVGPEGDLVALCRMEDNVAHILVGFPAAEGGS